MRRLIAAIALVSLSTVTPSVLAGDGKGGDKAKAEQAKADKEKQERLKRNREQRARDRERRLRERILNAQHLEDALAPWVADITACYRKYGVVHKRASGTLQLEILVAPNGRLRHIYVVAPGVRGKKLKKCVTAVADKVDFPKRKGFTKATIPFRFLQAKAKGAGPLKSCWSKRGCPSKRHKKKATTKSTKKATKKAPKNSGKKKSKKAAK